MVKFDLLLLPLIGGYIFLITSYFTKFYHQRLDRQRLIFNSVIAGILISIIGLYLNELLKTECFICLRKFFKFIIPLQYDGLTTVLTAFSELICGETYHIKMGITNISDNVSLIIS